MSVLESLSPFMIRSRAFELGRDRLYQHRNKLLFLLITTDISENSKRQFLRDFPCPVFQHLTMADTERLFGCKGTKVLGFKRTELGNQLMRELKPYRIETPAPTTTENSINTSESQPSTRRNTP